MKHLKLLRRELPATAVLPSGHLNLWESLNCLKHNPELFAETHLAKLGGR